MKAMLLGRIQPITESPLQLADLPEPQPGPGEVRLKVTCCAICRTDLHVIEGDLPQQTLPIIPGHQIIGHVDQLGAGCSQFNLGQRVGVAWLRHTCGTCQFCHAGRENLCEGSRFTGYHAQGGYAEYAVVPEDFAYQIAEVFSDTDAAPLLCAGIIGYRALKRCNLPNGGRLALYGFGSSAHVVMQIALHRGCDVYVATRGEKHRDLARTMGAAWVGESPAEMPAKVDSAIIFAP
ncbi:MAG: zinc-binding alcohol dehydrogenase family protein, partial [Planctomycetes bacterium]|nr:zinc-binding alcohol dehydrogenase family protein [Planctomycetota bacterium]